ncbi:hypothetical protein HDU97_001188 [Phlyctochytrium planicorne]|nr:hypothetical protein HDU97_001188 [Phlyctochytrium planicorne]
MSVFVLKDWWASSSIGDWESEKRYHLACANAGDLIPEAGSDTDIVFVASSDGKLSAFSPDPDSENPASAICDEFIGDHVTAISFGRFMYIVNEHNYGQIWRLNHESSRVDIAPLKALQFDEKFLIWGTKPSNKYYMTRPIITKSERRNFGVYV